MRNILLSVPFAIAYLGAIAGLWHYTYLDGIRFSIIAVMFLLVALVVYTFVTGVRWPAWTGFSEYNPADHGNRGSYQRGKTLWEWMQLGVITLTLGFVTFSLNAEQTANTRLTTDNQTLVTKLTATEQQAETLLANTEKNFSGYLVDKKLAQSKPGDPIRSVVHTEAFNAFRQFSKLEDDVNNTSAKIDALGVSDPTAQSGKPKQVAADYKRYLVEYLYDAGLLDEADPIVDLRDADLSRADLSSLNLSNADLAGVNLSNADLSYSTLKGINLSYSLLDQAKFDNADGENDNLENAELVGTEINNTDFQNADLRNAKDLHLNNSDKLSGAKMPDGSIHP